MKPSDYKCYGISAFIFKNLSEKSNAFLKSKIKIIKLNNIIVLKF